MDTYSIAFGRKWLADALERIGATYVEAFAAILIANWTAELDLTIIAAAAWAAVPAALATLKTAVATLKGDPDTASLAD